MTRLYRSEPRTILVEYGETLTTRTAAFRVQCRSCLRQFGALSRRTLPVDAPTEDAVRQAAIILLVSLGCVVGEDVTCSYCSTGGDRPGGVDMRSWELRTDEVHAPVARGGWLVWAGDNDDV